MAMSALNRLPEIASQCKKWPPKVSEDYMINIVSIGHHQLTITVFPKLFELEDLKTLNKMLADHKIL